MSEVKVSEAPRRPGAGPGRGSRAVLIHRDDGRYAHMPGCNERCGEDGHWLQQASPAPWQACDYRPAAADQDFARDRQQEP